MCNSGIYGNIDLYVTAHKYSQLLSLNFMYTSACVCQCVSVYKCMHVCIQEKNEYYLAKVLILMNVMDNINQKLACNFKIFAAYLWINWCI